MFKNILGIYESSRKFPYEQYLITTFPFFAILFMNGFNISIYSLLLLTPFIAVMAGLFMYNTLCDAPQDPGFKNPITRGDVSVKTVKIAMWSCVILSVLLVFLLYKSYVSEVIFLGYLFISFSYSGLGLRFKETIMGPPIAAFLLFCSAPLLLLIEFNYFNDSAILLLLGLFIVYFGHEIKHTIIEYEMDKEADCRTFAVVTGKKNATIIEYLAIIIGFILLLMSISLIVSSTIINVIFILLALVSVISTILYGRKNNYDITKDTFYNDLPYIITKLFYIGYACLVLNLPELLIIFIIWILFTDKYL